MNRGNYAVENENQSIDQEDKTPLPRAAARTTRLRRLKSSSDPKVMLSRMEALMTNGLWEAGGRAGRLSLELNTHTIEVEIHTQVI